MENSWKKEKHQAYKTEEIDSSIKEFYGFLEEKEITGSVLDLGCGNGKNTIFFQKNGFEATGIDFAKAAITICKDRAKKEGVKARFQVASVLSYQPKHKFDIVIDCGCLHHIRRSLWKAYRKTLLQSLKVGGYYYLHGISDCKQNKNLRRHPQKRNWMINKHGHYTTFLSFQDCKRLLGSSFRILRHYERKSEHSPLIIRIIYAKMVG